MEPSDDAAEKRKRRKFGFVLVSVPGFPSQDPGRQMLFRMYPEVLKAERKAKRMGKRFPEYQWSGAELTIGEARDLKLKPFKLSDLGVEVRPTARGARVVADRS
jgi:hypothetical protein